MLSLPTTTQREGGGRSAYVFQSVVSSGPVYRPEAGPRVHSRPHQVAHPLFLFRAREHNDKPPHCRATLTCARQTVQSATAGPGAAVNCAAALKPPWLWWDAGEPLGSASLGFLDSLGILDPSGYNLLPIGCDGFDDPPELRIV